jgi:GxxExxY protein
MGALFWLNAKVPEQKSPLDRSIRGAFAVWRELGKGMPARIYRSALALELQEQGLRAVEGAELTVKYRSRVVGEVPVDLLVEEEVVVLVRGQAALRPCDLHEATQLLASVRAQHGLILNFGAPRLEYRRLSRAG